MDGPIPMFIIFENESLLTNEYFIVKMFEYFFESHTENSLKLSFFQVKRINQEFYRSFQYPIISASSYQ